MWRHRLMWAFHQTKAWEDDWRSAPHQCFFFFFFLLQMIKPEGLLVYKWKPRVLELSQRCFNAVFCISSRPQLRWNNQQQYRVLARTITMSLWKVQLFPVKDLKISWWCALIYDILEDVGSDILLVVTSWDEMVTSQLISFWWSGHTNAQKNLQNPEQKHAFVQKNLQTRRNTAIGIYDTIMSNICVSWICFFREISKSAEMKLNWWSNPWMISRGFIGMCIVLPSSQQTSPIWTFFETEQYIYFNKADIFYWFISIRLLKQTNNFMEIQTNTHRYCNTPIKLVFQ